MTTAAKSSSSILNFASKDGEKPSTFRNKISIDDATFKPEKLRLDVIDYLNCIYNLGIVIICTLAHRTVIVRALKGLEEVIGLSVVDPFLGEGGWKFSTPEETPGCIPDTVNNAKYIRELYFKANPDYDGSEIIRIFNDAFDEFVPETKGKTFYPKHLESEIDNIDSWVYDKINNDVYKCGFATTQDAYNNHIGNLFEALDNVEAILSKNEFLVGNTFTEADIRLWPTIIR
ncbi:7113_t:CDS:2 [Racocetra fulgida]|uniref:7113_t:CDS:1 n=1 Tax=Racocetra fulgida TaxID=60492 RepID=A0A9N8W209_9GLOM|nr:7113_t:CDS:2 [Racocetra fulgida]